jgi:hypothetical protein
LGEQSANRAAINADLIVRIRETGTTIAIAVATVLARDNAFAMAAGTAFHILQRDFDQVIDDGKPLYPREMTDDDGNFVVVRVDESELPIVNWRKWLLDGLDAQGGHANLRTNAS